MLARRNHHDRRSTALRALLALAAGSLFALLAARPATGQTAALRRPAVPAQPAEASEARERVIPAVRAAGAVTIDGRIDAAEWAGAAPVGDFVQRRPDGGRPASQRTEARILYDDGALYVAMRMHDTAPDSVAAALGRRDFWGFSDWAHVVIDSYHDRRTAFRFGVNPAGVRSDAAVAGDEEWGEDAGWDAVWDAAATRDSAGWSAEMRIPLSQLRFSAAGEDGSTAAGRVWGVQFVRDLARRGERSLWAPVAPEASGYVSHFGELRDLQVRPRRRLETIPYLLGRVTRAPGEAGDPFHRASDLGSTLGVDVRYGVTSDLTLTATVNPDFGQVEADPSQVNLSGSEIFLAERRPFFVEGGDIFRVSPVDAPWIHGQEEIFYSRRIGRAPRGEAPDDAQFSEQPTATRLLGAAKLSGKTAGGWSVGVLDAVTGSEEARFLDASGSHRRVEVEPATNYAIARVMRDFRDGRSALGLVLSSTERRLSEATAGLVRSAWVGGVDGRHRLWGGDWQLNGTVLASRLDGSAAAIEEVATGPVHRLQRPDADHLEFDPSATSLSGAAATLRLQKVGGGSWRGGVAGRMVTSGFDANDLGFHTASDLLRTHAWVGYDRFRAGRRFQRWSLWSNNWSGWTTGGERIATGSEGYAWGLLANHWTVGGSVRRELSSLSPSALRGGPALFQPGRTSGWLEVGTDTRRRVRAELQGSFGAGDAGGRSVEVSPSLTLRPSTRLDLWLGPTLRWNRHPAMWVGRATDEGSTVYLGGELRQRTASLTTRLNLTFTPDLTLQLYAQPFASAGRYPTLREVADPRAADFDRRFRTYAPGQLSVTDGTLTVDRDADGTADFALDSPDFHVRELNSNAVLRWEYRPGSTLFLVWSQGRSGDGGDGTLDLGRDAERLWSLPQTNTLLLKWSHWIGG